MTGQEMYKFKNWAVIGDVLNEGKYACSIVKKLENRGYNVFKVNPREDDDEVYKSLKDIKEKVEVINLVITPRLGIKMLEEAHQLGIDKIYIQPGAESSEIFDFCKKNCISVYEGCVLAEMR